MNVLKIILVVILIVPLVAISILAWFPFGGLMLVFLFASFFFRYALRPNRANAVSEQPIRPLGRGLLQLAFSKDLRVACIVWLFVAALIAGLGWWYPNWVADRNSAPDDRYGFVLMGMMPFYLVGVIIAFTAGFRLLVLISTRRTFSNTLLAILGVLLASVAVSPAVVLILRLSR